MSDPTTAAPPAPSAPATSPVPPAAPVAPAVQSALTLVMTIKSPEDYQQLNGLLNHFQSLPPDQNPIVIALNKIGTVHFARFVFLENNTKLAVITAYDGSFEKYINDFVNEVGDIFDALLSHMTDAPPLPVQSNRAEFLAYVRANDFTCIAPFYSAYPTLSVLDIQAFAAQN